MNRRTRLALLATTILPAGIWAATVSLPHVFSDGQVASADQVNENFSALADEVNAHDGRIGALEAGGGGGGAAAGASLPGTAGAAGATFLDTSTSQLYVSSGTQWIASGSPLLGTPGGFAVAAGNAQVAASWTGATNATGYEVGASAGTVFNAATAALSPFATTSGTLTGLTNGQTYTLAVRSANGSLRSAWTAPVSVTPQAMGAGPDTPAPSCAVLLSAIPGTTSGPYWIDPNGGPTSDSFQAWCDMDTLPGGWTVIAKFGASSSVHMNTADVGVTATNKVIDPSIVDGTVKKLADADVRALYTTEFRWHRSDSAAHVLYFQPQSIASYATTSVFTQRCRTESGAWSVWYSSNAGEDTGLTSRANPAYTVYCSYKASPSGNWDGMVAYRYSTTWFDQCGRRPDVEAGYCSPTLNAWVMVR